MKTHFVVLAAMLAAAVAEDMCCKTCTEPAEKFLSVDTKRNMCGETCMDPKDFKKFHFFEKNLQKADSATPCADRGFSTYNNTVTHGALNLKITLDLYSPDSAAPGEMTLQAGAGAGYTCPGSAASLTHASCKQTAVMDAPCAIVAKEIQARVQGQYGTWHDPHNNGTYSLVSATNSTLQLVRMTGNKKYKDKITITLAAAGNSCTLMGCSESQVFSVLDYSTNYCNVRSLYCGSNDGCKKAGTDLTSTIRDTQTSVGATSIWSDCLKV